MAEPFYMLEKKTIEEVKTGQLTIEDFGFLCGIACLVNPHNGYCLENFSSLGNLFGILPHKAKYMSEKLKKLGRLWFSTKQGQRRNFHFFVLGLQMVTTKGMPARIVTLEYIQEILPVSEVEPDFQKSKQSKSKAKRRSRIAIASEVPYIEIEKEIEREKESEIPRASRPAPSPESLLETFNSLKATRGEREAREYFQTRGYPIPSDA